MGKMKKQIAWLLVLAMLFALTACGNAEEEKTAETDPPTEEVSETTDETEKAASESEDTDPFPSEQVITWIIAAAAGNPADTAARIIAPKLEEILGQTIVIENRGGAGGINALGALLEAEPDGYTWSTTGFAHIVLTPHSSECPYEHDSFAAIGNMFVQPQIFAVAADAPYQTFEEFVNYAKENPGSFRYATSGASSIMNLTGIGISQEEGISLNSIVYDSDAEALIALLGGHVEGCIVPLSNAIASINEGTIKVLCYTTETKSDEVDAENLQELGLEMEAVTFNGVLTSKNIPENRLQMLRDAFQEAMSDPQVIEQLSAADLYYGDDAWIGDDFQAVINDSYTEFTDLLNETGLMEQLYP